MKMIPIFCLPSSVTLVVDPGVKLAVTASRDMKVMVGKEVKGIAGKSHHPGCGLRKPRVS